VGKGVAEMSAPKKIYLQTGDEKYSNEYFHGSTWCEDKINSDDTEYIKEDIVRWYFETKEALEWIKNVKIRDFHHAPYNKWINERNKIGVWYLQAKKELMEAVK
jgi:hypothetical protein